MYGIQKTYIKYIPFNQQDPETESEAGVSLHLLFCRN